MAKAKTKVTKKAPVTDQELKDRLWAMVERINFTIDDIDEVTGDPDYAAWDAEMRKRGPTSYTLPGFEVDGSDLRKIVDEVTDSCLTPATKEAILKAVKSAKAK